MLLKRHVLMTPDALESIVTMIINFMTSLNRPRPSRVFVIGGRYACCYTGRGLGE
jgi:hypothetical protein